MFPYRGSHYCNFWLMYPQVEDFCVSRGPPTVPLMQILRNAVFSSPKTKARTLCTLSLTAAVGKSITQWILVRNRQTKPNPSIHIRPESVGETYVYGAFFSSATAASHFLICLFLAALFQKLNLDIQWILDLVTLNLVTILDIVTVLPLTIFWFSSISIV